MAPVVAPYISKNPSVVAVLLIHRFMVTFM